MLKTTIRVLVLIAVIECYCLGVSGCYGPEVLGSYYIEEKGQSVAVDGNGNVYVTGLFTGTVDFDPGPEEDEHTSNDLSGTFLSKFDSSGAFSWARTWGGDNLYFLMGRHLAVDGDGSVYVAGSFDSSSYSGTVDLDPGPSVDKHTGRGVFLSRFDSDGVLKWSKAWRAYIISNIAVDGSANIYVNGYFTDEDIGCPIDLDPGPAVNSHPGAGQFLSKFDSTGEVAWIRVWDWREGAKMAVADNGDVYLSGILSYSPFLCKVEPDGNSLWFRTLGGVCKGLNTCVAVDPNSNLLVGGTFSNFGNLGLSFASEDFTSNGKEDIFLGKFESDGDPLWGCTWGGSGRDYCQGVAIDNRGNVYVTGYFDRIVDFDPDSLSDEHRSNGGLDVYLSKFDPSGTFLWVRTWGGSGWDKGDGIAYDGGRYIYVTGEFCGLVDFDPGAGRDWHQATTYNDIFLSKFTLSGSFVWARTWGGDNPIAGG